MNQAVETLAIAKR